MQNESTGKTLIVALCVCLVCSILVSATAVSLKGIQNRNRELDKLQNILDAGGIEAGGQDLKRVYNERISPVFVELKSGRILREPELEGPVSAEDFDIKESVQDEAMSRLLQPESDIAQIRRIPNHTVSYTHLRAHET